MTRTSLLLAACLMAAAPASADRFDGLRAEADITEALVQFSMARRIYRRCEAIGARRMRAIGYLTNLVELAEERGYARPLIRAYADDEIERDRISAIADARLAARGATEGNEAGFCAVGQAEIAAGSTIGRLLR